MKVLGLTFGGLHILVDLSFEAKNIFPVSDYETHWHVNAVTILQEHRNRTSNFNAYHFIQNFSLKLFPKKGKFFIPLYSSENFVVVFIGDGVFLVSSVGM